jgi:hypothetical protein
MLGYLVMMNVEAFILFIDIFKKYQNCPLLILLLKSKMSKVCKNFMKNLAIAVSI